MGGSTTSADFGASAEEHGFIYAVTMAGDWLWGNNYFYQKSRINSVDLIVQSPQNTSLDVWGTLFLKDVSPSVKRPFIMRLDPLTGRP